MNENERINEMTNSETVNVPETPVLPFENDRPEETEVSPLESNTEQADAATFLPEQNGSGKAECSTAEGSAVCCDDEPESFFDRVLDVLYTVWDAILDLMVALHILEEALSEQEGPQITVTPAPESPADIFPVTFAPEAALIPSGVPSAPIPVAG